MFKFCSNFRSNFFSCIFNLVPKISKNQSIKYTHNGAEEEAKKTIEMKIEIESNA